jgi:hypothetical protein
MRKYLAALALLVLSATFAWAQSGPSATFTWNGSTDSSQLINLASVNGQPNGGAIQIVNGSFLWLLELPESLGFPNNGYLDCQTAITFGANQWGTRADGSTMNGTQAGDYYTKSGTTSCPLWNGTTAISLTEYRVFIAHRYCYRGVCKTSLTDTMENGSGSAVVQ